MGSLQTIPTSKPTITFLFKGTVVREECQGLLLSEQAFQYCVEDVVGMPACLHGVGIGHVVEAKPQEDSVEITCETAIPLTQEVLSKLSFEFVYSYYDFEVTEDDPPIVGTAYLLGVNLNSLREDASSTDSRQCMLKEGM